MTALPNLPGGNNANVFWINNLGQISGDAENGTFDSSCSQVTPFQVHRFQPVIWGPNGEIRESPLSACIEGRHCRIRLHDQRPRADRRQFGFVLHHRSAARRRQQHAQRRTLYCGRAMAPSTTSAAWEAHSTVPAASITGVKWLGWRNRRKTARFTRSCGPGRPACWTTALFPGRSRRSSAAATPTMIEARSSALASSRAIRTSGAPLYGKADEPKDLNDFVRDPGPFVQLTGAFSINDAGEIVCQGVTNSRRAARLPGRAV